MKNRRGQSSWWFEFSLCSCQSRGQEAATLGEERFREKAKPEALLKAGTWKRRGNGKSHSSE